MEPGPDAEVKPGFHVMLRLEQPYFQRTEPQWQLSPPPQRSSDVC